MPIFRLTPEEHFALLGSSHERLRDAENGEGAANRSGRRRSKASTRSRVRSGKRQPGQRGLRAGDDGASEAA